MMMMMMMINKRKQLNNNKYGGWVSSQKKWTWISMKQSMILQPNMQKEDVK